MKNRRFQSPEEEKRAWKAFGLKRDHVLSIPYKGAYSKYEARLFNTNPTYITVNGIKYELKKISDIDYYSAQPHTRLPKFRPYNTYTTFWEKNDPIFAYAEELYLKITTQTFEDPQELKKHIATFHWLLANCPIFRRGTASVLEVLTDAMWLSHGYLPQPIEEGKSLDLEALCIPNVEDFIELYPMATKPTDALAFTE